MTTMNNSILYTGVTNDLQRRVLEHRSDKGSAYTMGYKLYKLVYYEIGDSIESAIVREKKIKSGSRMRSQTFSATDEELKSFVCTQQNTIE
jgi:putative endonuclease